MLQTAGLDSANLNDREIVKMLLNFSERASKAEKHAAELQEALDFEKNIGSEAQLTLRFIGDILLRKRVEEKDIQRAMEHYFRWSANLRQKITDRERALERKKVNELRALQDKIKELEQQLENRR